MNTGHLKSILLLLLFCVGLLTTPHAMFALSDSNAPVLLQNDAVQDQDRRVDAFTPDPTSVFLAPSREFVRPLVRAKRLLEEGDVEDAAGLIGEFLAETGDEDFLVLSDKEKGTAISINRVAADMLGQLPKSAIESYRVRFGVPARQRLSVAVAESNYFELAQVMQRYPYTDAGIEAAMLMGHHHFDAGRALLAAESFQRALNLCELNGKSDPQLSVLTAVSWALARRPKLAESVMKNLANKTGGKFKLGDQQILIDNNDPLAAIKSFLSSGPLDSSTKVDQWLLVGGNARKTVTSTDGFPVGQPLWQVDVADSRIALRQIENTRDSISSTIADTSKGSLVPANVPLIVDGLVLVGNEKQISAIDFQSGKRVWAVASSADAGALVKKEQLQIPQARAFQGRIQFQSSKALDQAPWTDFLQGHASSDGKFIYHVVRSLLAPAGGTDTNQNLILRISGIKTTNTLQAIDVLNQGKLAWELGGGQTTGDPRLADVSFLGAPLPIDGVLYAIGKHLQEIVLVAVNSKDGKLIWMQPLASDESSGRNRYNRMLTGKSHSLTPSYSKGILVCPTGKNALVAVDTIGRRVLWGAQIESNDSSSSSKSSGGALKDLQNPQVFIENSRVVAFDVSNSPRLLAVSLLDGSPLMKIGKAGVKVQDALHVASVDENRVVLVEKNRVRAISSDSGRKLWETSIRKYGPPTGRGYVSEKALYLPTEGNTVIKIDLNNGKIVDGIYTNQPLGNLIVHQGRVISRRETSVACFDLDSKVIIELDAAAKAAGGIDKLTPALKIKRAALLRNQGSIKQAIELLQTVPETDRSERFKTEFMRNATLVFDSDPEYGLTLFEEYQDWFQFDADPTMFLGYVELLVKNGMLDNVVKQLFKDDSFFNRNEPEEEEVLVQRPIATYTNSESDKDGDQSDDDEAARSDSNQKGVKALKSVEKQKSDQRDAGTKQKNANGKEMEDDKDKGKQKVQDNVIKKADSNAGNNDGKSDKKASSFLKSQSAFDKNRMLFNPKQWAKVQLIRIARDSPESVPRIEAAIKQQIDLAALTDVLEQHRFMRQFPLELVTPQLRFKLAQQLIAKHHVAEAENLFASLLGFLPTKAEQIETAEIIAEGLSKDSLVELWSKIHDSQYGTPALTVAAPESGQPPASRDYNHVSVKSDVLPNQYTRDYPTVVQPRGEFARQIFKGKCVSIWGGVQELEVLSPTGETETRFKLFKSGVDRQTNLRGGSGWLQTNHSLAIIRQRDIVLALDLSKLEQGQESVVWKRNVVPALGWRPEIVDELDLLVNPALRPEDVTASFPATGCCCFIDKDKLTCVDAFSGATLWARTKDANHGNVLASGDRVVTMDAKLNQCSVFDVRTGERLETRSVSDQVDSLWDVDGLNFMAVGNVQQRKMDDLTNFEDYRVVEDDQDGKPKSRSSKPNRLLARYDLGSGEFIWRKVFDGTAKISRISGERFMVLSQDSQVYIFDSKTGEELKKLPSNLTEAQQKKVRFIGGFEQQGKDLLVFADTKTISVSAAEFRIRASHSLGTFFSGHLMLISQDELEPIWDRIARVDGFQILPMSPSASPLLLLNRRIQSNPNAKALNAGPRPGVPLISRSALQLVALNLTNGRVVVNEVIDAVGSVRFTSPLVDLEAGTIEINFAGREIMLGLEKSTDEPPSPVASVTKLNPVPQTWSAAETSVNVADNKFDIDKLNKRLVQQAKEYEASLEQRRKQERALLEKETSR